MNIAIVDDSESDRQLLQELLIRYFDTSGISITIYPFQSGEFFWQGFPTIPLTLSFSIFSWMRLPVWTRHTNY